MATTAKQSRHQKKAFLNHFRVYGNVTYGARHAGIDRTTVYWWQEHDEEFAVAYQLAQQEAIEHLEAEARRRAVEGVERLKFDRGQAVTDPETGQPYKEREYSDTLLIFILKALAPDKYADRAKREVSGPGGQPIQIHTHADLSDADLDEKIRALSETEA